MWCLALFFVCAHLGYELATVAEGETYGESSPYFVIPAVFFSVTSTLVSTRTFANRVLQDETASWTLLVSALPLVLTLLAWGADVLSVFLLAFTLASVILVPLYMIGHMGLARYEHKLFTMTFYVSRCSLYAVIRSVFEFVVQRTDLPCRVARLFPFCISLLESIGMFLYRGEGTYTFSNRSSLFGVYVTLKSAIFLALPLLEEQILGVCVLTDS